MGIHNGLVCRCSSAATKGWHMKYIDPRRVPGYRASGRERLAELARFLEALPAERLTFSRWYGDGVGCAVGLAAMLEPWFQAQGLALRHDENLKECQPVYDGRKDWRAVTAFFDLTQAEARELFAPHGYGELRPDPKRIAAKIRGHIEATDRAFEAAKIA
jgi:hypothetical protein